MSERSRRPRVGRHPGGHQPGESAPDTDTFDDLVRACRALAQDPGLDHSAEAHRRVMRRARGGARAEGVRRPLEAL